ncbi:MAG: 50S ribosomal protein L19 [Chlamydiae bacterium]|nr:50S ribosomal protein L19 [Chlamydiota bacterium]
MNQLIESIEAEQLKTDIPDFKVGDTISIHYRIIEGAKTRIQIFTGTVIARKRTGISESVSLYRVAYGSAMERVILIHSPRVAKIEVVKRGKVRKGKLYHLRGVFGKKAKIQERIFKEGKREKELKKEEPIAAEEKPAKEEKPKAAEEKPAKEEKPKAEKEEKPKPEEEKKEE